MAPPLATSLREVKCHDNAILCRIYPKMYNKITNYFRGSYQELKKVIWPTKKETINHTLMVIGISLGVALFLGALDFLFTWLFERFIK